MKYPKHIRCAGCRFTAVDHKASEYSARRCSLCEKGKDCEIRKTDKRCEEQTLLWAAIQCVCTDSEYHRALLNVTPDGDMQGAITWSGCEFGERRSGR
jgi:hypothetical protein